MSKTSTPKNTLKSTKTSVKKSKKITKRAISKKSSSIKKTGIHKAEHFLRKLQLRTTAVLTFVLIVGAVWSIAAPVEAKNVTNTYNDTASSYTYTGWWPTKEAPDAYGKDIHYSNASNAKYKVTFTGTQARLYTEKSTRMGIMAISLDGGPEKLVDAYAKTTKQQVLIYISPVLATKKHTLTVRVTGKKNAAATNTWVIADKVAITRMATIDPTPTPTPAPTTPAPTVPAPTASNSYYVAVNGNDAAAGSAGAPWKTIQKAANSAPAGSTVLVKAGTYAPFSVSRPNLTIMNNGSDKVIVKATSTTKYVVGIAANNVTVSGMTATGCVPDSSLTRAGVFIGSTTGVKVLNMTISESNGKNAQGYAAGCYGISTVNANSFTLSGNEIFRNGSGIDISGGAQSSQILNNKIHDNNVIILNSNGDNDDYGGVGITFANVNASPGPLAQGNTIYNNVGPSHDYGTDGGAFEIYKSSNVRMLSNTMYNNDGILETGTDSNVACSNNVFNNNVASGRTNGSKLKTSVGMILRCNKNMQIANNTLGPVDSWLFDIEIGGTYGGVIDGLAITNNKVTMGANSAVYAMMISPSGHGFNFSGNQYKYSGSFAWSWTNNTVNTLADWQKLTGLDKTSTKL